MGARHVGVGLAGVLLCLKTGAVFGIFSQASMAWGRITNTAPVVACGLYGQATTTQGAAMELPHAMLLVVLGSHQHL
jgi:hypothetical protein